ncbi:hypothetical protein MalM25_28560 [Planctomycetes bacterium MalM25]|nr:hypothetical protein MalM25_28560 [Planctomycetes bacterium MalM25]
MNAGSKSPTIALLLMNENDVAAEKLPPFVSRDGESYRLDHRQAWAYAIVIPFVMWGCGFLLLGAVLRFVMRYNLNSEWWTSSLFNFGMMTCLSLGLSIAGVLKQKRAIKRGVARLPWHQLSLLEMLVITTAIAGSVAIASAQQRAMWDRFTPIEQQAITLRRQTSELLGPDGGVGAKGDALVVWIQDGTFDDRRLAEFTDLAEEEELLDKIEELHFMPWASRPIGTTTWRQITNASTDTLDRWTSLRLLEARRTSLPMAYQAGFESDTNW